MTTDQFGLGRKGSGALVRGSDGRSVLRRAHFAFYRGYAEGLALPALSERFFPAVRELSPATLRRWIADEISAFFRWRGDERKARLFAPRERRLDQRGAGGESFEVFARRIDPEAFYAESELLSLYAEHRRTSVEAASAVWRKQLLSALDEAERHWPVRVNALATDDISDYLPPSLGRWLKGAGFVTIADVTTLFETGGRRWFSRVPGLGPSKAARVAAWIRANCGPDESDPDVSAGGRVSDRAWSAVHSIDSIQFDAFPVSAVGNFVPDDARRAQTALRVASTNLRRSYTKPNTHRRYEKELERLALWAWIEIGFSLDQLTNNDLEKYEDFLRSPPSNWKRSKTALRGSPKWRPLDGPLNPASASQARRICQSLLMNSRLENSYEGSADSDCLAASNRNAQRPARDPSIRNLEAAPLGEALNWKLGSGKWREKRRNANALVGICTGVDGSSEKKSEEVVSESLNTSEPHNAISIADLAIVSYGNRQGVGGSNRYVVGQSLDDSTTWKSAVNGARVIEGLFVSEHRSVQTMLQTAFQRITERASHPLAATRMRLIVSLACEYGLSLAELANLSVNEALILTSEPSFVVVPSSEAMSRPRSLSRRMLDEHLAARGIVISPNSASVEAADWSSLPALAAVAHDRRTPLATFPSPHTLSLAFRTLVKVPDRMDVQTNGWTPAALKRCADQVTIAYRDLRLASRNFGSGNGRPWLVSPLKPSEHP